FFFNCPSAHFVLPSFLHDALPIYLLVSVRILDREVFAKVWQLPVGRINLFLLDTDISENNAEDRLITAELYGGDQEMRMRQEIIDRKSTRLNSSHLGISYAVFCLK